MVISALETFGIGVGPSSSHMVGPMRAAKEFVTGLLGHPATGALTGLHIRLGGSLAWTGAGHGTPAAVVAGLCGLDPEDADADRISSFVDATRRSGGVQVGGVSIPFDVDTDIVCDPHLTGEHPNVMELMAMNASCVVVRREFLSIGGGVVREPGAKAPKRRIDAPTHPFTTAVELLDLCRQHGLSISEVMRANELTAGTEVELEEGVRARWHVMSSSIDRGCDAVDVELPGSLRVPRRAPGLAAQLVATDSLNWMDRVTLYAMAVNEENAAGGRVVTAPTNGAAGVFPAVLRWRVESAPPEDADDVVMRFFFVAAAFATILKQNASISGAEVGCQGEVGSACAMAAAALCESWGGLPHQVENAAEIAIEHHLGLTCDPVGGLVQIPCIERNGIAATKAVAAARLALRGTGSHRVSFDQAVEAMLRTGRDMRAEYRESSRGGLAVTVPLC